MVTVRLSATIGADRKLAIQLPDEIPAGEVEIEIRAAQTLETTEPAEKSTEPRAPYEIPYNPARAKLRAAGILSESTRAPEGTVPLTVEERMKLGTMPPGSKSSLELINEDRGSGDKLFCICSQTLKRPAAKKPAHLATGHHALKALKKQSLREPETLVVRPVNK